MDHTLWMAWYASQAQVEAEADDPSSREDLMDKSCPAALLLEGPLQAVVDHLKEMALSEWTDNDEDEFTEDGDPNPYAIINFEWKKLPKASNSDTYRYMLAHKTDPKKVIGIITVQKARIQRPYKELTKQIVEEGQTHD